MKDDIDFLDEELCKILDREENLITSYLIVENKDDKLIIRFDTAIMYERRRELEKATSLEKEEVIELSLIMFIDKSESAFNGLHQFSRTIILKKRKYKTN